LAHRWLAPQQKPPQHLPEQHSAAAVHAIPAFRQHVPPRQLACPVAEPQQFRLWLQLWPIRLQVQRSCRQRPEQQF
jgi:hypothetical protein